jgi:hypothetical protein
MSFIKRVVTVLALVYLLLALLILFFPFVRSSTVGIFSVYSLPMEVNLLLGFLWASVVVVGLLLIFETINSGLLRRSISKQDQQLTQVKTQLHEAQRPASVPGGSYPPASGTRRPDSPPATSPPAGY